jgi:BON domain-containing protein
MRPKLFPLVSVLLLALLAVTGCAKFGARSDSQVTSDVQSKINSDSNIQTKQISVAVDKGVVTLSGTVASDLERSAAANDAGQVEGVKTVVNNLQTSNAGNASPQSASSMDNMSGMDMSAPAAPAPHRQLATRSSPARSSSTKPTHNYSDNAPSSSANNLANTAAPAPPPEIVKVTVPAGTRISVRLTDPLSSETNKVGDTFRGTLDNAISQEDKIVVPRGADVQGRIIAVKPSTHFTGNSELTVELTVLDINGKSYDIATDQWDRKGTGRGKRTAATVGGGAALGAVIGAIAGGGKGAAIGAGAGAAAGTGVQGVTKGQKVELPPETVLDFELAQPVTVTPAATRNR